MTSRQYFLLFIQLIWSADCALGQHTSPYSLQAAVDELKQREAAKYPLNAPPSQQHYFAGALGTASDQDYWDDDGDFSIYNNYNYNSNSNKNNNYRNRHRLNKALAKYLERENYDADLGGLSIGPFGGYEFYDDSNNMPSSYTDEKKRSPSYFRERDIVKYDPASPSVFRERESEIPKPGSEHAELTEQFLREIEEAQEQEREEHYKEALRRLWEKYQEHENALEQENELDLIEEKKRMRVPPYYMLMQKRSYPVLPWLPYSEKKKRFPVAKRSTKSNTNENLNFGKTDDRVALELNELFGDFKDDKKKRSTDGQSQTSTTKSPTTTSHALNEMQQASNKNNSTVETPKSTVKTGTITGESVQHGHAGFHSHPQKEYRPRKRSNGGESHESHEEEDESDEHDEHEEEDDEEDEHEEIEEEDDDAKKKKRSTKEIFKADEVRPVDLTNLRRKKSIQWGRYFGIDRKKKSLKRDDNDMIENDKMKKKRAIDPEKLENMDKKLQSIEDFIIDETIKYTGAHEGIVNPDEIRRIKDHVLSRLATAYSLEKMRRALDKLRQSVDNEHHLLRNSIEPEHSNDNNDDEVLQNEKRLSVKKEQAQINDISRLSGQDDKTKEINSNAMMSAAESTHGKNDNTDDDDNEDMKMKKKKKKRNGYLRYPELPNELSDLDEALGINHYEPLNDAYLGNKNYIIGSNQCPIIESMAERCRGVDLLSGDINQELLPICGVHQICYLCGTSQGACDYQYLSEADAICGDNNNCQATARSVLMILRGAPGPQLGPRECLKNPCLYSAMREIGL